MDFKNNLTGIKLFKEFDIFYVCYDEPNRKENWDQVKKHLPKAQKIEGVKGFDRALKTCAQQTTTKHFFIIDGDNQVLPERFAHELDLKVIENKWVLSWSSLNTINGLSYGNGGLKLWPKDVALNIKSHESAGDDGDPTDYCFSAHYFMIDDYLTQTIVNSTPQQAFRAGLREGVKMTLKRGQQVSLNRDTFTKELSFHNRERLKIWCEVGADVENGLWAILGARLGFKLNIIDRFEYQKINSYQWIDGLFLQTKEHPGQVNLESKIDSLGEELNTSLNLDLKLLAPEQSRAFKRNFKNPPRSGLLSH